MNRIFKAGMKRHFGALDERMPDDLLQLAEELERRLEAGEPDESRPPEPPGTCEFR